VGVADVRLTCRGETVVHEEAPRGTRRIRYRHYLAELARKPQPVRQVADELLAELGAPFERFWRALLEAHPPREAVRTLAGALGLIAEYGEARVREALDEAVRANQLALLSIGRALRDQAGERPAVTVPAHLAHIEVESAGRPGRRSSN